MFARRSTPKMKSGFRVMTAVKSRSGIILLASLSALSNDSTLRRFGYCSTSLRQLSSCIYVCTVYAIAQTDVFEALAPSGRQVREALLHNAAVQ